MEINLKGHDGIFKTVKLIDAFKIENGHTVVLISLGEKEHNLLKIYISIFDSGKLIGISPEEWDIAKISMSKIVQGQDNYELVKLPKFVDLEGNLKPCLIASTDIFEKHYSDISSKELNFQTENFRFTNGSTEWETEKEEPVEEKKEEIEDNSLESIVNRANAMVLEEKKEEREESLEEDNKVIEASDYKSQKEKLLNILSRALDDILDSKNSEINKLNNLVEQLQKDLRKCEQDKKQAINIINMYHDKIKKLNEVVRGNKDQREGE